MAEKIMKEWLLFALFLIVGVGMLIAGVVYMRKEKDDPDSVRIYRAVAAIGGIIAVVSVICKTLI